MFLFSCQKEISFDLPQDNDPVGNQNGNLLVKALQITLNSNDTNVLGLKWNAANRLIEYTTNGVVNGFPTKATHQFIRSADNKILEVISSTALQGTIMDSARFKVYYQPGTNHLSYVTGTQYSFLGEIKDSSIFEYNGNGQVISKEIFVDFWGSMDPSRKETYEWDGNGNCIKINKFEFNGMAYEPSGTSTLSYSNHKSMVTLGEESFIVFDASSASVNHGAQVVMDTPNGTSTLTYSNEVFNSFDRPTEISVSVTPIPPGYQQKLIMYYE